MNIFKIVEKRIELKIIAIILIFATVISSILGFTTYKYITNQLSNQMKSQISILNEHINLRIKTIVKEKERIGLLINKGFRDRLDKDQFVFNIEDYPLQDDGTIRELQGKWELGAFVPVGVDIDRETQNFLSTSYEYFSEIMPFVTLSFLDVFYITNKNVFRLSQPGEWLNEAEPDFNRSDYPFYYLADKMHNPEKKPVWIPVYYDKNLGNWMTSLIIPDYKNNILMGVSGNDYSLDKIFQEFIVMSEREKNIKAALFDSQGKIIVHPDYMDQIKEFSSLHSDGEDYSSIFPEGLKTMIHSYCSENHNGVFQKNFLIQNEMQLGVITPLEFQGWYIVSYISHSEMAEQYRSIFYYIIAFVVFFVFIVSFLVSLGIRKLILNRLYRLKDTAEQFFSSEKSSFIMKGYDEIALLSQSFEKMAKSLDKQFSMEKLVSKISRGFNNVSSENVNELITISLRWLGQLKGLSASYFYTYTSDNLLFIKSQKWIEELKDSEDYFVDEYSLQQTGWLYQKLTQKETLIINNINMLSEAEKQEILRFLKKNGNNKDLDSLSLVLTPVFRQKKLFGLLGLFTESQEIQWDIHDIQFISVIGQIYSNAIQRMENEFRLSRAQKMEAIGTMAGGVAHDLNNILSGLVSYPELILMKLKDEDPMKKRIEAIRQSGIQASKVVDDLLTVARGISAVREVRNINLIIESFLDSPEWEGFMSQHPHISIDVALDYDLKPILCSSIHIRKCIMNLMTNASEAMDFRGVITLKTHNEYVNALIQGHLPVHKGEYSVVSVHDFGSGIEIDDLSRIFEPFYTKKIMGKSGTGLGLAVVLNTVKDHQGGIIVKSDSKGTLFKLFFPVSDEKAVDISEIKDLKKGNGEFILVVDDEPRLRDIAVQILETLNYRVDVVSSGEDAIEYMTGEKPDLILLDMQMGKGLNGLETYKRITEMCPGQKAVIASGFSKNEDVIKTLTYGPSVFVRKPYTMNQLSMAVFQLLNSL